jgi:hypothetical protein
MFSVIVSQSETFDNETQTFNIIEPFELKLEHSLLSLSKWESKFEKPFLGKDSKTSEEVLAYIECMILNETYPDNLWELLDQKSLDAITDYIESKQSATTFGTMPEHRTRGKVEVITSELVYYWMVAFNIPFEPTQSWHLNRLFSLIKICSTKQSKSKKMSKSEIAQRNRELNARRRAELGTSG